jgi:hypothetical protein
LAYPTDATAATGMQMGPDGKLMDINEIANLIYGVSQKTYSGKDEDGKDLEIRNWDMISKACTGKEVSNPCTYDNTKSGPLSPNCISYLYKNGGAADKSIGPTYTGSSTQASLGQNGSEDQFCTPNGSLSPQNADAMKIAQKSGGVAGVKKLYNDAHQRANNNSLPDAERKEAIKQCYGTNLVEQAAQKVTANMNLYNKYFCTPAKIADRIIGDGLQVSNAPPIATIQVLSNWKWSFTLTLASAPTVPEVAVLFVSQLGNDSWNMSGGRSPSFVIDKSLRLYVYYNNSNNGDKWVRTNEAIKLNAPYTVEAEYRYGYTGEGELSLTYGTSPQNMQRVSIATIPGKQGQASVYVGKWYPSFTGTLTNVSYCSNNTVIETPLDNPAARTKNARSLINYSISPQIVATFTKQATELGPYGMEPWGTWFTAGFPSPTNAKWIWNTVFGALDSPDGNSQFRMVVFIQMFRNTTADTISATMWVGADDFGRVVVNDATLANNFQQKQGFQVSFPPGENLISIGVTNYGGPAGLVVDCKDTSGKVLFVSDSSWKIQ